MNLGIVTILVTVILDLLVIWDIFHAPFQQSTRLVMLIMILIFPVLGVIVYHLIKPALTKKTHNNLFVSRRLFH